MGFSPRTDHTNKRFGRLLVLAYYESQSRKTSKRTITTAYWQCICDCGNEAIVAAHLLAGGKTRSCGCLYRDTFKNIRPPTPGKTHGMYNSPEYYSWQAMKARVLNVNSKDYKNYGGRGITICDRWLNSFQNFLEDMGERPEGTSIDRIDVNGNYEPGNCRWADPKTQNNNRRK